MYHIVASMRRLGIAMVLVFIAGTALGIACGMNRKILAAVDPFIQFYRALPPLAYNTLIVLWMGIGDGSKIMLLFLSGFAPLFIQVVFGVQKVPQDRINGARSLGAGNFVIFRDVILPCGAAIVIRLSWLNCALKSGSTRRCTSMTRVIWRK